MDGCYTEDIIKIKLLIFPWNNLFREGGGLFNVVETSTEEAAVSQHFRLQKQTNKNKQNKHTMT